MVYSRVAGTLKHSEAKLRSSDIAGSMVKVRMTMDDNMSVTMLLKASLKKYLIKTSFEDVFIAACVGTMILSVAFAIFLATIYYVFS